MLSFAKLSVGQEQYYLDTAGDRVDSRTPREPRFRNPMQVEPHRLALQSHGPGGDRTHARRIMSGGRAASLALVSQAWAGNLVLERGRSGGLGTKLGTRFRLPIEALGSAGSPSRVPRH